jgi:hypothetical protein
MPRLPLPRAGALIALAAPALAGCGEGGAQARLPHSTPTKVWSDGFGNIVARKTDPVRGLVFTVVSDRLFGTEDSLSVRLAPHAPARTRADVTTRRAYLTCTVPGHRVEAFPQVWNRQFRQLSTALLADTREDDVIVATQATSCSLWLGGRDGHVDTHGRPYSTVILR